MTVTKEALDKVYSERNKLAAALAQAAKSFGYEVGIGVDPQATEPEWSTVLFIDLPHAGQVSWHFHESERSLLKGLPAYTKPWDGHTDTEKYERLRKWGDLP